jgi:hypothetical protein
MKVKVKKINYNDLEKVKKYNHKKPVRQWWLLRILVRILSVVDLWKTKFKYELIGMNKLPKEPCLVFANHSSFIDAKIMFKIFKNRSFNIVSAKDSFIGKRWLMRRLGCFPTHKFVNDVQLVKDIQYCLTKLKSSVIIFPEAGYSFDGTKTVLPESLGKMVKLMKVPVLSINIKGAYSRDPLYNNLQVRKVKVSADVKLLMAKEDISKYTYNEINDLIINEFSFDAFKWQYENNIKINEKFRADHINRILYKCPYCLTEGKMIGKGVEVYCEHCGKTHVLNELGQLEGVGFDSKFSHIPDWCKWEREEVRNEIMENKYELKCDVDLYMIVNTLAFYKVGEGTLVHNNDGITLDACDGNIKYHLPAKSSYTLNCDYFFYEIGDVISFGDMKTLYYCFPKNAKDVVCKARYAAEEMYKIYNK